MSVPAESRTGKDWITLPNVTTTGIHEYETYQSRGNEPGEHDLHENVLWCSASQDKRLMNSRSCVLKSRRTVHLCEYSQKGKGNSEGVTKVDYSKSKRLDG